MIIVDACTHVGDSLYNNGAKPEEVFEAMSYLGAKKSIICPVKPFDYNLIKANNYILDLVEDYPDKFIGFVRVDPNLKNEALKEVKRGISKGLKGIYLHPWEENFQINNSITYPILDFAEKKGKPVMIEGGYPWVSHATQVLDIARKFPNVKLIITNAGQLDLSGFSLFDVTTLFKSCKNVYMLTNAAVGTEWLASLINDISDKRVIFGTGLPVFDPKLEILRIKYLENVSEEKMKKVLGENILEIL